MHFFSSPSIVFISQTLITGDGSFVSRLAHEISHSWFGLLIGAMDWTEEWLSEGFATFLEDPIQAVAEKVGKFSRYCKKKKCTIFLVFLSCLMSDLQ